MILEKEIINGIEIIYTPKDISYKKVLICIPGGGKTIGASRFNELQEQLFDENIGSVSINFAGVEGSSGLVETDNLENRINTTIDIINWVQDNFTCKEIALYGVSMGGYVILGALQKTNSIGKIILHTPATYAKESKEVNFDEQFTTILRTPESWKNSESFDWLQNINNPVLYITHSEDEIIPKEILKTYENILIQKDNTKIVELKGAKHIIWNTEDSNKDFKEHVTLEIINFLK